MIIPSEKLNVISHQHSKWKAGLIFVVMIGIFASFATQTVSAATGKSGLPLPRFASLKSARVNMRVGPGSDYKITWMYVKRGLPIEIIQEFDNWRKVRDPQGNEGWILHSLLSGKRTAIVSPWDKGQNELMVSMFNSPDGSAHLSAKIEPGVIAKINYCENQWCELSAGPANGFVKQDFLWGVYPDETIQD